MRRRLAAALNRTANAVSRAAGRVHPGRKVLILGGARSGKSRHAERLLAHHDAVCYVATGAPPGDDDLEWARRIDQHRKRRPGHWRTVETTDVAAAMRQAGEPVLVDCIATWLARQLDETGAWDDRDGWQDRMAERTDELIGAWLAARVPVVAVSNEVGSGVVPATPAGRLFRDELGVLNARLAEVADTVLLVVAGRILPLEK